MVIHMEEAMIAKTTILLVVLLLYFNIFATANPIDNKTRMTSIKRFSEVSVVKSLMVRIVLIIQSMIPAEILIVESNLLVLINKMCLHL